MESKVEIEHEGDREIHKFNLPSSKITAAIMTAIQMHYAVPGVPDDPHGLDITKVFGAMAGSLAEIATVIHKSDPAAFYRIQPMMSHAIAQLAHIVSSYDPGRTSLLFLATGLSQDGRRFDPPKTETPTVPS